MPSDFTSCSSGMNFSPPQSHVFLSTRSLSRSLPAIDHKYFEKSSQNSSTISNYTHSVGATELRFLSSAFFIKLFLNIMILKIAIFIHVASKI